MTRIGKNASACQPKWYEYQPQIYEKEFRSLQLPVGRSSVCIGFIALRLRMEWGGIFDTGSGMALEEKTDTGSGLRDDAVHLYVIQISNDTSLGLWFVIIPYQIPVSDFDDCNLQA